MLTIKNKIEQSVLIKALPFKKNIRKTVPHKHHNYFEIIYLSEGTGTHTMDYQTYEIQPSTLFFMHRDQVHHWDITSEPEGFVIIIKNGFIEKSLDGELKRLFAKLSEQAVHYTQPSESVNLLLKLLVIEGKTTDLSNFVVIESLLKALISKIFASIETTEKKYSAVTRTLFQQYIELLSQSTNLRNHVAHYAELLNTTPQNLNAICRKEVNQTAAQVLSTHLINEAKRQLIYTDNRVSEIAFSLDFVDASHFVKYFKRHTGLTPMVFRSQPF